MPAVLFSWPQQAFSIRTSTPQPSSLQDYKANPHQDVQEWQFFQVAILPSFESHRHSILTLPLLSQCTRPSLAVSAHMPGLAFHLRAQRLDPCSSDFLSRTSELAASAALCEDRCGAHSCSASPYSRASALASVSSPSSSSRCSGSSETTGMSPMLTTLILGLSQIGPTPKLPLRNRTLGQSGSGWASCYPSITLPKSRVSRVRVGLEASRDVTID